jgi:hypothetical protein
VARRIVDRRVLHLIKMVIGAVEPVSGNCYNVHMSVQLLELIAF